MVHLLHRLYSVDAPERVTNIHKPYVNLHSSHIVPTCFVNANTLAFTRIILFIPSHKVTRHYKETQIDLISL